MNLHGHNHEINEYKSELYMLKNKYKVESRQSRETLGLVFGIRHEINLQVQNSHIKI